MFEEIIPHPIKIMKHLILQLKSLMVIGIDVCKDAFNKGMVVVGFVASINLRITRYFYNDSNIFFHYLDY